MTEPGRLRVHVTLLVLALAATTHPDVVADARHDAATPFQNETMFQEAYIKASNTGANDKFGSAVAISGNTAVVGAPIEASNATGINGDQANNSAPSAGAAYVFVRTATGWVQQAYLKASNTGTADQFGAAVAIDGDTIVVGAPNEGPGGAAYVFVRNAGVWTEQQYLKASNFAAFDAFGTSVAVSGDTIIVGAYAEDSNATIVDGDQTNNLALESGAAYVFVRSNGVWTQQAYLKASNSQQNDNFGWSVGISGDTVVVGAYRESSNATGINGDQANNSASQAGAAYVFTRSAGAWTQQAYLKGSNTGIGDVFGWSVAISADTIVVGAWNEKSAGVGVDGNQTNGVLSSAGAAYVFDRVGGSWAQSAYLKASNTGAFDRFAYSVAIDGDVVVAGATLEDSDATGVNGNGGNDLRLNSGAAYVYVRIDGAWQHHAYLKASNPDTFDTFGHSVAVSRDTVVVGAISEASSATGVNAPGQNDNSLTDAGAAYAFRFPNTDPTITGGSVTRWPATSGRFTVASVDDAQDSPGSLRIDVQSANPSNGVTLANLMNSAGTVTADVIVAAGATTASFVLQTTDFFGASAQAAFDVIVTPAVTITPSISPAANGNGWHNGPVTVSWTLANSTTQSGCVTTVLSTETSVLGTTLTCTAGNAGGSTSQSATIKIDLTPPLGTATRTPGANANGWNNDDVTVSFTCADALSGAVSPGSSETITSEGAGQSRTFLCIDSAGNGVPLSVTNVNIDKTAPAVMPASVLASPNPVMINTDVSLTAGLTDGGSSGLMRAEFRTGAGAYSPLASVSGAAASATGSIGSFAQPNVLEACVRGVDLADNYGSEECILLAVFDPTAGYVTGAGTIDSPPGALVGSTATGAARFGFQSKYARGATLPSGSTQFRFRTGDFEFDSVAYEWLVVSGARAQYKGTGVIKNQNGAFDFILTVIDGDQPGGGGLDRFRIKITGPGGVVYDNQMGAADNADPTTVIAGGHIVIRK